MTTREAITVRVEYYIHTERDFGLVLSLSLSLSLYLCLSRMLHIAFTTTTTTTTTREAVNSNASCNVPDRASC